MFFVIFPASFHAKIFATLKRKNLMSSTPLNWAQKALSLALKDSAEALVLLLLKKFKILVECANTEAATELKE